MDTKIRQIIAVDLGGTKLRAAIILSDGRIVYRKQFLTGARSGPEKVISKLTEAIASMIEKSGHEFSQIKDIALAVAGAIDVKKGIITSSPNLPGWTNIPLANIIKNKFNINTFLVNDASAAAFGEYMVGAGKGKHNLVYLTVSTGIGGGIIINDKLYEGISGSAAEIGHMIIKEGGPKCNCGKYGCLESLAASYALTREVVNKLKKGKKSILKNKFGSGVFNITAKDVWLAAKTGDKLAQDAINEIAYYLGIGMANIINIFNPEMIIVGGGLSKMGKMLVSPAASVAKSVALQLPANEVEIVIAQLGDNAGIIGAALLANMRN